MLFKFETVHRFFFPSVDKAGTESRNCFRWALWAALLSFPLFIAKYNPSMVDIFAFKRTIIHITSSLGLPGLLTHMQFGGMNGSLYQGALFQWAFFFYYSTAQRPILLEIQPLQEPGSSMLHSGPRYTVTASINIFYNLITEVLSMIKLLRTHNKLKHSGNHPDLGCTG